jgi:hypothetical protein
MERACATVPSTALPLQSVEHAAICPGSDDSMVGQIEPVHHIVDGFTVAADSFTGRNLRTGPWAHRTTLC